MFGSGASLAPPVLFFFYFAWTLRWPCGGHSWRPPRRGPNFVAYHVRQPKIGDLQQSTHRVDHFRSQVLRVPTQFSWPSTDLTITCAFSVSYYFIDLDVKTVPCI